MAAASYNLPVPQDPLCAPPYHLPKLGHCSYFPYCGFQCPLGAQSSMLVTLQV